jgi:UDP-3-O-[3-hydroxymyristoyl] N-acetylglucosamine deacetylase
MQTTIKGPVNFKGVGLHTGRPVRMTLKPAPAEFGVWFRRVDSDGRDGLIAARWDQVVSSALCTKIANDAGVSVMTIEHVMAAIAGCGLTNVLIEIDGPEVPILDGSAALFVQGILSRGLQVQAAPVRALRLLETVEVRNGDAFARLEPAETLEIAFRIEFEDGAIGRQEKDLVMSNGTFVHELADSRTFCRSSDVEMMRARGLALGGTYENAVVVDGDEVLTPGGLRHVDEAVRHKMLDALGDLALAGAPLLARYTAERAGHAMTNALLRTLFARPAAFRMVELLPHEAALLPGAGVRHEDLAPAA